MTLSGLSYLASTFLWWWLASLVVGLCVGWFTASRNTASGWALWIVVLAVVLLVAVYRLLPDRYGLWLDTAALFLFAYFIGCLIGSVVHNFFGIVDQPEEVPLMPSLPMAAAIKTAAAPETVAPPAAAPAPQSLPDLPPPSDADKPAGLAAPHTGKADDLQLISGIGPQNESRLHGLGIYHFYQIAGWSAQEVNWVGHFLAFPGRIEREHWVAQAKALLDAGKGSAADMPPPSDADKPAGLAAPHTGKADDLQLISGIGPQNESRLHGLGIYHFYQIAGWSAQEVNWVGHFLAFPGRIEREHWVAQAKALLDAGKGSSPEEPATDKAAAIPETTSPAAMPQAAPSAEDKPAGLAAPRADGPDDLRAIRGIGPQNEQRLHGLGIYHFDQIAAWSAKEINWVGHFLAFPGRIEREEWVAQAKILASGGKL